MSEAPNTPKKQCFVISPIGDAGSDVRRTADQLLRHIIKAALGEKYDIVRGDEDENPGAITPQIVASILEADLVVADLSGFNPSVYYEVAIAHGYDKPTVHLQNANEKPSFDLKDQRTVRYDLRDPDAIDDAKSLLLRYATFAVSNPQKVSTPLSGAQLFVRVDQSNDVAAQAQLEVSEQLRRLRAEVTASTGGGGTNRSADIRSLRKLIERTALRGALSVQDLRGLITSSTSAEFDEWIVKVLRRVDKDVDPTAILQDL